VPAIHIQFFRHVPSAVVMKLGQYVASLLVVPLDEGTSNGWVSSVEVYSEDRSLVSRFNKDYLDLPDGTVVPGIHV
jgi:hypothetical protein